MNVFYIDIYIQDEYSTLYYEFGGHDEKHDEKEDNP